MTASEMKKYSAGAFPVPKRLMGKDLQRKKYLKKFKQYQKQEKIREHEFDAQLEMDFKFMQNSKHNF